jgi:hypothetical protein
MPSEKGMLSAKSSQPGTWRLSRFLQYSRASRPGGLVRLVQPLDGGHVALGIKSRSQTRVWCEALEGEMPAELLVRLEKELGQVEGWT